MDRRLGTPLSPELLGVAGPNVRDCPGGDIEQREFEGEG